jgi:hypothetical protein
MVNIDGHVQLFEAIHAFFRKRFDLVCSRQKCRRKAGRRIRKIKEQEELALAEAL